MHTIVKSPSEAARLTRNSMSASFKRCSEWFKSVPTAPASFTASSVTNPVKLPGGTASACCAKQGMLTEEATCARKTCCGHIAILTPLSEATSSHIFASLRPFCPIDSAYAFTFITIIGVSSPFPLPSSAIPHPPIPPFFPHHSKISLNCLISFTQNFGSHSTFVLETSTASIPALFAARMPKGLSSTKIAFSRGTFNSSSTRFK